MKWNTLRFYFRLENHFIPHCGHKYIVRVCMCISDHTLNDYKVNRSFMIQNEFVAIVSVFNENLFIISRKTNLNITIMSEISRHLSNWPLLCNNPFHY